MNVKRTFVHLYMHSQRKGIDKIYHLIWFFNLLGLREDNQEILKKDGRQCLK